VILFIDPAEGNTFLAYMFIKIIPVKTEGMQEDNS